MFLGWAAEAVYKNEAELLTKLLADYKSFATPIKRYGTPVDVFIEASLRRLDDLVNIIKNKNKVCGLNNQIFGIIIDALLLL